MSNHFSADNLKFPGDDRRLDLTDVFAFTAPHDPHTTVLIIDCYTNGRPEDFDEVVAPGYLDYGHTPPGRGPGGARDDYENAVKQAGAVISYTIDALVADAEMVAAAWTGTLPGGAEIGKGLSLYRTCGGLLRSTRHALIGTTPS